MISRTPGQYHIQPASRIPLWHRVRDIILTLLAWALWVYICWDVFHLLEQGLVKEPDNNPGTVMDWQAFFRKLQISYIFSGAVLLFLVFWAISNSILLRRTEKRKGMRSELVTPTTEAEIYGCRESDIKRWRKEKILTISIDNTGKILSVKSSRR